MIDDATLAEWEQDIEQALRPSSVQQGAMWAGTMVGHLRDAIAEIRRLREELEAPFDAEHIITAVAVAVGPASARGVRRYVETAKADLAAHRAVVQKLANGIDVLTDGHNCTGTDCARERAEAREALTDPLVVAARTEGRDE